MELEFDRDTMICYETVAEVTLCQEETLESIVPDACPDILRIVDVCGQAMLTGTQASRAWRTCPAKSGENRAGPGSKEAIAVKLFFQLYIEPRLL